jgi:hypothetical protein
MCSSQCQKEASVGYQNARLGIHCVVVGVYSAYLAQRTATYADTNVSRRHGLAAGLSRSE